MLTEARGARRLSKSTFDMLCSLRMGEWYFQSSSWMSDWNTVGFDR
jgi:hypothetical protein